MELDELKLCWEQLSEKMEKQQTLNTKIIEQMTQQNYSRRLNKIFYPELIASILCLIAAIIFIAFFNKLDTMILQVLGVFTVVLLVALVVLSLMSVRGLKKVSIGIDTYAATISIFFQEKIRFQKLQKLNIWICFGFLIVFFPVIVRMMGGKDISQSVVFWLVAIPLSAVLQLTVSRWVLSQYNGVLRNAEAILADLEA